MAASTAELETLDLFGGERPWSPLDWTDSDDRVRGGKSQSYLEANSFEPVAHFYGNLDIETLGGAGFASQRTSTEENRWDLHDSDGICIRIAGEKSDSQKYTFIIKDSLLPADPDTGREQSTISWESDFSLSSATTQDSTSASTDRTILIPFSSLKPTYRGKEMESTRPLLLGSIRRFSIMNKSFFGKQSGSFSLYIRSISAYRRRRSRFQAFMKSKAGPPMAFVVGTFVLMRGLMWGIDTFVSRT